jgi:hypothetical protein
MRAFRILALSLVSASFLSLSTFGSVAQAQSFNYCKADIQRLCKGVPLGGGKVAKCLKTHENDLTVGCAKELKAMKAKMGN